MTVDCAEKLPFMLRRAQQDRKVVFPTDYPHLDVKYPHAVESFLKMPFTDQSKRKYLWDSCARLYGFGY